MTEKSPAFQFYPKDFLTDEKVLLMSNEEIGQYIKLLCIDWINDGITEHMFNTCSTHVQLCFNKHPTKPEIYTNSRLLKERQKQQEFREKKIIAGQLSGKARQNKRLSQGTPVQFCSNKTGTKRNSSSSSSSSNIYISKDIYKQFVHLSKSEYEKFQNELGQQVLDRCIEKLDSWIASDPSIKRKRNGKNAAACFRSWVINAVAEEQARSSKVSVITPTNKQTNAEKSIQAAQNVLKRMENYGA